MVLDIGSWLDSKANPVSSEPSGLFQNLNTPVPLKSRQVFANVYAEHAFAEVTEVQTYIVDEDATCKFVFPIPSRSAIYK